MLRTNTARTTTDAERSRGCQPLSRLTNNAGTRALGQRQRGMEAGPLEAPVPGDAVAATDQQPLRKTPVTTITSTTTQQSTTGVDKDAPAASTLATSSATVTRTGERLMAPGRVVRSFSNSGRHTATSKALAQPSVAASVPLNKATVEIHAAMAAAAVGTAINNEASQHHLTAASRAVDAVMSGCRGAVLAGGSASSAEWRRSARKENTQEQQQQQQTANVMAEQRPRSTKQVHHRQDTNKMEPTKQHECEVVEPLAEASTTTHPASELSGIATVRHPLPVHLPSTQQVVRERDMYFGPTDESNWVLPGRLMVGAYPSYPDDDANRDVLSSVLKLGISTFVCLQDEYEHSGVSEDMWRFGNFLRPYIFDAAEICRQHSKRCGRFDIGGGGTNADDGGGGDGGGDHEHVGESRGVVDANMTLPRGGSMVREMLDNFTAASEQQQEFLRRLDGQSSASSTYMDQYTGAEEHKQTDDGADDEGSMVEASRLRFVHVPIVDCECTSDSVVLSLCINLCWRLVRGEVLYVHCWGGHGRTGTVVAIMLGLLYGLNKHDALARTQLCHDIRRAKLRVPSPQTQAQRDQVCRILDAQRSRGRIINGTLVKVDRRVLYSRQFELPVFPGDSLAERQDETCCEEVISENGDGVDDAARSLDETVRVDLTVRKKDDEKRGACQAPSTSSASSPSPTVPQGAIRVHRKPIVFGAVRTTLNQSRKFARVKGSGEGQVTHAQYTPSPPQRGAQSPTSPKRAPLPLQPQLQRTEEMGESQRPFASVKPQQQVQPMLRPTPPQSLNGTNVLSWHRGSRRPHPPQASNASTQLESSFGKCSGNEVNPRSRISGVNPRHTRPIMGQRRLVERISDGDGASKAASSGAAVGTSVRDSACAPVVLNNTAPSSSSAAMSVSDVSDMRSLSVQSHKHPMTWPSLGSKTSSISRTAATVTSLTFDESQSKPDSPVKKWMRPLQPPRKGRRGVAGSGINGGDESDGGAIRAICVGGGLAPVVPSAMPSNETTRWTGEVFGATGKRR